MKIFPAIDLYEKKVVRLVKGDYSQMTVYSDNPLEIAVMFNLCDAEYLHVVDLEGAKNNNTANFDVIKEIVDKSGLLVEVGGGIRNRECVKKYIDAGVMRVILGTAAICDREFLEEMVEKYKEKIAVGVDIRNGYVATHGWAELSDMKCFDFCAYLEKIGVKSVICTDISKDGMLGGTNMELYKNLNQSFDMDITASGGISTIDDVVKLKEMGMYGAILGKALYTADIDLKTAVEICE